MNKQLLVVIGVAIALFGAAIGASLAFVGSGDGSGDQVHTMPNGQTMTGGTMTGGNTMPDGETMDGTMDAP